MSYFDHNATTPLSPAAREAWLRAVDEAWQNPSSPYRSAHRVRNLLEDARERLARLLGCDASQVVFNSGGTEGVNSVFQYCATQPDLRSPPAILSPVEHSCVLQATRRFFKENIRTLPLSAGGFPEPADLDAILGHGPAALVSVMAANNETGIVHPWQTIAEVCRSRQIHFHCDAAQWVGKLPVNGLGACCGFVTAAAHKFGGPKGCGFLILPAGVSDFQSQVGGEQEHGARAGTEDYPAIAAMLAALEEANALARDEAERAKRTEWREEFERTLQEQIPGAQIVAQRSERLWNTVSIVLPHGANDRWVRKLDRAGFEVSIGSACSTGKDAPSHVLAALGFSKEESKRALRVSSGWRTTRQEWLDLAAAMVAVHRQLEQERPGDDDLTEVIKI